MPIGGISPPLCRRDYQRTLLYITILFNRKIHQLDLQNAYPQPGFQEISKETGKPYAWRLEKSLSGIASSGKTWNNNVDQAPKEVTWAATASNPCLQQRRQGEDCRLLAIYVDD